MKCLLVADLHYDLHKFDWVVDAAGSRRRGRAGRRPSRRLLQGRPPRPGDRRAEVPPPDPRPRAFADLLGQPRSRQPQQLGRADHQVDRAGAALTTCRPTAIRTRSATRCSRSARGTTARAGAPRSPACSPGCGAASGCAGSGCTTRRPRARPRAGTAASRFGDASLRSWIRRHQPDVVLSGHVHQSPFSRGGAWADRIGRTWVFNAGHQDRPAALPRGGRYRACPGPGGSPGRAPRSRR